MNKKFLVITAIVVGLSFILYFFVMSLSSDKETSDGMNHSGHTLMVASERDFIEHMIPHHQEAVETASLVLEKGGTLRPLRELAEAIVIGQTTEIETMKDWYQKWYKIPYEDTGVYTSMMRSLGDLSGAELDRVFLEDMIMHHEMAVSISKKVLTLSISQETEALANDIVNAQQNEIEEMKVLLQLLPQ